MSQPTPGSKVRQIVPAIQGEVSDMRWNPSAKELEVLVHYSQDGEDHNRWFLTSQVAVVDETPAPAAAAKPAAK